MRSALYFDTPTDFCDFVKLQGDKATTKDGSLFEFHRISHPNRPANFALVLFNFKSRGIHRFIGQPKSIQAEVRGDLLISDKWDHELPVIETKFAKTLVEMVNLSPWSQARADQAISGSVLFRVKSPPQVAALISDSLQLGNDRIYYATLKSDDQTDSTLLRIDNPSFYLIQCCLEERKGDVEVYYPTAEAVFTRWGWEHPLQDWWKQSGKERESSWIFLDESGDFSHLEPVIWQEAYDLTDLELDFQHRREYSRSSNEAPRFTIPLRLEKKASGNAEPELWLLDEGGIAQIESALQITDDESLRFWQLSIQTLKNSSRDWLFVRELRSKSKGSRHYDFGGIGFARYRGINDLLLPLGYELQPPLRRDVYRELFQLEPGFCTVLIPEENSQFLILKISERSFDSLSRFVDYIVERDAAELEELMERSIFDFKEYLKAPRHPGLAAAESSDEGNQKKSVSDLGDLETELPGTTTGDEKADGASLLDSINHPESELDESSLGELEKAELQLERKIVAHGQHLETWCQLLHCKNQLGKTADSLITAIEALWLARGSSREEMITQSIVTLAKNLLEIDPLTVTLEDQEWMRRAAVFRIVLNDPLPGKLDEWISETSSFLREHHSGLRAKEQWLAWGQILSKNQDERREAQLREEIRNRIAEQGLGLENTPSFLRSRIFLDRKITGETGNLTAVENAIANLASLQTVAEEFQSERLIHAASAVLARAYSNIGDIARAEALLSAVSESADPCARAWETMFRIEALRGIDQSRAKATDDNLQAILKEADPETRRAIEELKETYRARGDADNPAAFLARENRSRTYPRGPGTEKGALFELSIDLERHITAGDEVGAVSVMRAMMTLEDKSEYDHHVKLPQFVETLVAGLEKFKWGDRGTTLIPLYEEFTGRIPGYVTATNNQFYGSILHSNLAHGLLVVENIEKAIHQLNLAFDLINDSSLSELDFIDAGSALIRTTEQLPLEHRKSIITHLLTSFREKFDVPHSPYLNNERLFSVLARSLDQIAEAASSKDQVSLQQFRSYHLQDEFIILQRIQEESFIKKNQS